MGKDPALTLHIDPEVLTPIVQRVVTETLSQLEAVRQQIPDIGRLAYTEEEAARMLGLASHQLRDERLRGRIGASAIVGRRIRYTPEDLRAYLASRRVNAGKVDTAP